MAIVTLPTMENLPYHPDKLPNTTKDAVETLANILRFKMHHNTKRNEYTLSVLCGVILFRHLNRFQKMEIRSMIRSSEGHIDKSDWDELEWFCTDMSVQPKWWLWAMKTEELQAILDSNGNMKELLAKVGIGATFLSALEIIWEKMSKGIISKKSWLFIIGSTWAYVEGKQYENAKNEMDMRTPDIKPKSSSYY